MHLIGRAEKCLFYVHDDVRPCQRRRPPMGSGRIPKGRRQDGRIVDVVQRRLWPKRQNGLSSSRHFCSFHSFWLFGLLHLFLFIDHFSFKL